MKFEQWWEGRADKHLMDKRSAETAFEWAWQASKEDSKPEAIIWFEENFNGGLDLSGWRVNNQRPWFRDKAQAESWAINNGYRIKG